MLTRKQRDLLVFLDNYLRRHGMAPSFEEMRCALSLRSRSGVHRLLLALEERGHIRRLRNRARAIEIVRPPLSVFDGAGAMASALAVRPSVFVGSGAGGIERLPLCGVIAAGTPIEAVHDVSEFFEVPASLLSSGEHYALRVAGDSMIDAGINDRDLVIIQSCATADNGEIVVVCIDEQEVSLKRLRRHGHSVALEPANSQYETRIFPLERVRIQGRLVGLFRSYR